MSAVTSEELFPILIADLLDAESCDLLRAHAQRGDVVVVPLLSPPVDRRRHLLEIYTPGATAPMRLMAEPVGAPTEAGFPLRLELCAEGEPGWDSDIDDAPTLIKPGAVVRSRLGTNPSTLTERHSRDLDPPPAVPVPAKDPYLDRSLAGGKYRLDACVGTGGMGSVYRGHHRDLDLVVAVKVLHASFQADAGFSKRFQAEALTMSRIDHPSVTRVLDFGQERDGLLYLVMEFLDGTDLQSVVDREGHLPLERLVRIMMQVCAALGHVHRHGIIHRDIKPGNILLVAGHDEDEDVPTEVAKVCDFGIALASGAEGARVAGTPHYMSPEQCMGREVDARSDIYACGVLLYELATGVLPFDGDAADILARQIREAPSPPSSVMPDLDPLFEAIIMKALAKDPAARQQNMRQLRTELKELLAPVILEAGEAAPLSAAPSSAVSEEAALPFEGFERIRSLRVPSEARGSPAPTHAVTAPSSGRMSRAPAGEVWLDEDSGGVSTFLTTLAGTVQQQPSYHDSLELIETFARDPQPWLSRMAATMDAAKFEHQAEVLQKAVTKLMAAADAATISPVIRTMRAILKEGPIESNPRAKLAGRVLRILRDPPRLAPLVELALGGPADPSEALRHVFVETQSAGAQALIVGRQEKSGAGNTRARVRFVALLREVGAGGLPVTRAVLSDCLARASAPAHSSKTSCARSRRSPTRPPATSSARSSRARRQRRWRRRSSRSPACGVNALIRSCSERSAARTKACALPPSPGCVPCAASMPSSCVMQRRSCLDRNRRATSCASPWLPASARWSRRRARPLQRCSRTPLPGHPGRTRPRERRSPSPLPVPSSQRGSRMGSRSSASKPRRATRGFATSSTRSSARRKRPEGAA